MAEGIECFRIQFSKGLDANTYALKVSPAAKSLGLVIRKAVWLGKGPAPEIKTETAAFMAPNTAPPTPTKTGGFDYELVYEDRADDSALRCPGLIDVEVL